MPSAFKKKQQDQKKQMETLKKQLGDKGFVKTKLTGNK